MICYHHNDLDGKCAAAIVLKRYPGCRMREIDYTDDPDFSQELEHGEKVIIVDFSFKPEKLQRLFAITHPAKVTWIDHHETASSYKYTTPYSDSTLSLEGLRDFSQECKKSGCELTWEYLFPSVPKPEAVRLVGDYDCWRFDTKNETINFQFGMRAEYTDPTSVIWRAVFDGTHTLERIQDTGAAVVNYKTNISRQILQNGYNLNFKSYHEDKDQEKTYFCFVVNTPGIDSGMFDLHGNKEEYDFFISWVFLGNQYRVILKSINEVNVGKIAQHYGGGGHKGAAGFVCKELPF